MEAEQLRFEGEDEVVQGNKVGLKTALEDDFNAPKEEKSASNCQTKVTDPTGANSEEAGTTLVMPFEKMSVNEERRPEKGAGEGEIQEGKNKSSDRGVSMKEYLAEKFKPREEDKALSEVISGKLSAQKDKTEEPNPTVKKPEQVATQTRPATAATQGEGSGKGMIDRLKGSASSWFRKGGGKAAAAAHTPTTTTPDGT